MIKYIATGAVAVAADVWWLIEVLQYGPVGTTIWLALYAIPLGIFLTLTYRISRSK